MSEKIGLTGEAAINAIRRLGQTHPIILIGPTAAGKDTIVHKTGLKKIISTTTRPMREGEKNGKDYYFINADEIKKMEELFAVRTYETAFGEWAYGFNEEEGKALGIAILDLAGAVKFYEWREKQGLVRPLVVYAHVDKEAARQRQMKRGDYDKVEFERRWATDADWLALARTYADLEVEV